MSANGAARVTAAIEAAKADGRPALVAYLTAGFPAPERFGEHLAQIAAEADVVEIGVPFSDPMADGPTIQRSSRAALASGVSLEWILGMLSGRRVGATTPRARARDTRQRLRSRAPPSRSGRRTSRRRSCR